jgi:hypothetical protein
MIESSEHFYDDDPARGHADVRTRLDGVSYFFIGNGLVQGAVQWAPRGEATPLGLLVMDPERLRKKREALTMAPDHGLGPTMLGVCSSGGEDRPCAEDVRVRWVLYQGVPAAEAVWRWRGGEVVERFFCPDRTTPRLVREVTVLGPALQLSLGSAGRARHARLSGPDLEIPLDPAAPVCSLIYELDAGSLHVRPVAGLVPVDAALAAWWASRPVVRFGHDLLDRFWRVSTWQLSAVVAESGRFDASIWQYNREWVRDQAFVALGLLMAGDRETGGRILRRLLREFVTPEGGCMDSSEVRARDEAELDQNGVLLHVLHQYVLWTGDLALVKDAWDRIAAVADYPLRTEFGHPSGLLHNCREFWERHRIHGIEPGFELAHHVFVSIGLFAAAALARRVGRQADASRWDRAAARLRAAMFDSAAGFVVDGVLVKRTRLDGSVQDRIQARPDAGLPPAVPLAGPGPHLLSPDTSTVLPIAFDVVDPRSALAARTLDLVEGLWNQAWSDGGHGRYDVSSEPDSPGPWPFASIFVARAAVEVGRPEGAWRVLEWLNRAAGAPAGSWFEFYGPRIAPPFPQVGVIPWTWSEVLSLLMGHLIGVRMTDADVVVRPRLLPGVTHAVARLAVADREMEIDVTCDAGQERPRAEVRFDGRLS